MTENDETEQQLSEEVMQAVAGGCAGCAPSYAAITQLAEQNRVDSFRSTNAPPSRAGTLQTQISQRQLEINAHQDVIYTNHPELRPLQQRSVMYPARR